MLLSTVMFYITISDIWYEIVVHVLHLAILGVLIIIVRLSTELKGVRLLCIIKQRLIRRRILSHISIKFVNFGISRMIEHH